MTWRDNSHYAEDKSQATSPLAHALFRGELALFLGAGVSAPLGLPKWFTLVKDCCEAAGIAHASINKRTDSKTLQQFSGDVRRKLDDDARYLSIVSHSLYKAASIRTTSAVTPLLTALGALMMGSRRGRIREVWTLNFDDVLEWYLRINGFISQVITEVPCLLKDADVLVYHPHGYLPSDPHNGNASAQIVFDDTSYATRLVGVNEPLREATRNILASKIVLAIGLSWSDDILKNLVMDTALKIHNRPLAFWFFGPNSSKSDRDQCLAHNVVPLLFDDFKEYAPYLLSICEHSIRHVA